MPDANRSYLTHARAPADPRAGWRAYHESCSKLVIGGGGRWLPSRRHFDSTPTAPVRHPGPCWACPQGGRLSEAAYLYLITLPRLDTYLPWPVCYLFHQEPWRKIDSTGVAGEVVSDGVCNCSICALVSLRTGYLSMILKARNRINTEQQGSQLVCYYN